MAIESQELEFEIEVRETDPVIGCAYVLVKLAPSTTGAEREALEEKYGLLLRRSSVFPLYETTFGEILEDNTPAHFKAKLIRLRRDALVQAAEPDQRSEAQRRRLVGPQALFLGQYLGAPATHTGVF